VQLRGDSMVEVAALRGEQISAREEENRSIVANAVVAVFILDENREALFANHAAVDCFGYRYNGMGGLSFAQFVTGLQNAPEDAGYNAMGKTLAGGLSVS
jgi:PAS domain S-box-containing protein